MRRFDHLFSYRAATTAFLLFMAIAARQAPAAPETSGVAQLDLGGVWEFQKAPAGAGAGASAAAGGNAAAGAGAGVRAIAEDQWLTGTVPGCVHTDLLALGQIPDPFIGVNELKVQWIEDQDWIYRKTFDVSDGLLACKEIDLVCEGLDTLTQITLNGQPVGATNNMFRRWVYNVTKALRKGSNTLEIRFNSPLKFIRALQERAGGNLLPAFNDAIGGSSYIRKAPYHFGWDWGPRLVTCGIWKPIRLVAASSPWIENVWTVQRHTKEGIDLDVTVELRSPAATSGSLQCAVAGAGVQKAIAIPAGVSRHTAVCHVQNPKLWWPSGQGEQNLYDLSVTVAPIDASPLIVSKRIGFRNIQLQTQPDLDGVSFMFTVNGRPVFCKGANWIPCDSFVTRVDKECYRRLLTDAVACNMNMIRVWGGGIYENDAFYDLCDELGLMVWQDFMFSCALYPGSQTFADNVRAEAEDNLKRLMSHPSIALWCGNNEIEMMYQSYFREELSLLTSYRKLFDETLPEVCKQLDPSRPYWPSSPHSIQAADANETNDADCHIWTVWHGMRPLEQYRTYAARFVSEFGFQSFPPMKTIRAYSNGDILNMTAPAIEHHQKNNFGNIRIYFQMCERFFIPNGFSNFVILSQMQQAYAMQMAVEHWRRTAPTCMGTLYWQLNDCWPVTSWSSIDYYGRWKALQYAARRFYEPFHVCAIPQEAKTEDTATSTVIRPRKKPKPGDAPEIQPVEIWLIADIPLPETARIGWRLLSFTGEEITSGSASIATSPTVGILALTLPPEKLFKGAQTPNNCYLSITAQSGKFVSRNTHHFLPFKNSPLPYPQLKVDTQETTGGINVRISTDVFAKWVWLEAQGEKQEGRFSDNFFDLDPGETRTIFYPAPMPERFIARSLADTYKD
ncbi:MAG: glycoside hydrolase family 2 protein [Candidatus Sumerlaeota bacterium]|nr:glycoside hydrolase family 2 protein [Candidatus Sumerlaeota bacterium]